MKNSSLLALAFLVSCTPPIAVHERTREFASLKEESEIVIKYISYKNGQAIVDKISPSRWAGIDGGFSAGGRQDALIKFFSANTRIKSNSGQKHEACFVGLAQQIQKKFFDPSNPQHAVRDLKGNVPQSKASSDGMLLGLKFDVRINGESKDRNYFFRLPNCLAGKSPIDESHDYEVGAIFKDKFDISKFELHEMAEKEMFGAKRGIAQAAANAGFVINDAPVIPAGKKLPSFELRLEKGATKAVEVYPWKNGSVKDEASAIKLGMILQKYIYENMANQDATNPDMNFIAQKNTKRQFCHTPWLNVGPSGREGIHGMTKERDLKPSPTMDVYAQATAGSDWGVSFYNAPGCTTIANVYGTAKAPKAKPDFTKSVFGNDTFAAKLLFTTANFPNIKDAFAWNSNISEPGSTFREVKPVRHIQMDITVKDSSIKGSDPKLNNWIMYTYYYDPDFDYDKEYKKDLGPNPLATIAKLPKGFLKMRPMGVQYGFGEQDGIIFHGAQTNGVGGRLNGPADNPKGSCLGCHGTSGIEGMPMVPGFLTNTEWIPKAKHLDFSQQFALGKRNFETSFEKK